MTPIPNQIPEQLARDLIDSLLDQAGWTVQSKGMESLSASRDVAIRECQPSFGPADYALFVD